MVVWPLDVVVVKPFDVVVVVKPLELPITFTGVCPAWPRTVTGIYPAVG